MSLKSATSRVGQTTTTPPLPNVQHIQHVLGCFLVEGDFVHCSVNFYPYFVQNCLSSEWVYLWVFVNPSQFFVRICYKFLWVCLNSLTNQLRTCHIPLQRCLLCSSFQEVIPHSQYITLGLCDNGITYIITVDIITVIKIFMYEILCFLVSYNN